MNTENRIKLFRQSNLPDIPEPDIPEPDLPEPDITERLQQI